MGVLSPNVRLLLLTLVVGATVQLVAGNDNLRVAYQWNQIDFEFPGGSGGDDRAEAIRTGAYVPENVIPVGLEVYKKRLFLTLPRWKPGIPASLAYININADHTAADPLKPLQAPRNQAPSDGRPTDRSTNNKPPALIVRPRCSTLLEPFYTNLLRSSAQQQQQQRFSLARPLGSG